MISLLDVLTAALFITQLGDWWTTRTGLALGAAEANPGALYLMNAVGVDPFLGVKSVVVTALGYWIGSQYLPLLGVLTLFYVGVCIHNIKVMKAPHG